MSSSHYPPSNQPHSTPRYAAASFRGGSVASRTRWLHAHACRTSGSHRAGLVLDCGRHVDRDGGLDRRHRDLFRFQGRRARAADRPAGRTAIRLRGSHRRTCARRSIASPAVSCSIRSSSRRSSTCLLQKQSTLEQRSAALGGDLSAIKKSPKPARPMKPSPLSDNGDYAHPRDKSSALPGGTLAAKLNKVALSLDTIEQRQSASLGLMEASLDGKLRMCATCSPN